MLQINGMIHSNNKRISIKRMHLQIIAWYTIHSKREALSYWCVDIQVFGLIKSDILERFIEGQNLLESWKVAYYRFKNGLWMEKCETVINIHSNGIAIATEAFIDTFKAVLLLRMLVSKHSVGTWTNVNTNP